MSYEWLLVIVTFIMIVVSELLLLVLLIPSHTVCNELKIFLLKMILLTLNM
jgi:hypothetical protein